MVSGTEGPNRNEKGRCAHVGDHGDELGAVVGVVTSVGVATRGSSEMSLTWVLRCRGRCTPVGDIYLARRAADAKERYPRTPLPR